jgi:hypothetical protein
MHGLRRALRSVCGAKILLQALDLRRQFGDSFLLHALDLTRQFFDPLAEHNLLLLDRRQLRTFRKGIEGCGGSRTRLACLEGRRNLQPRFLVGRRLCPPARGGRA